MKFKVKVIPNAKKIKVSLSDNSIKVYLTTPAQDGKANEQLKEILAGYFEFFNDMRIFWIDTYEIVCYFAL